MEFFYKFSESFNQNFIVKDRYMYIVDGLGNTLLITLLAGIIGILLGIVVATLKVTGERDGQKRWWTYICDIYLTIVRGTPVMLQLLIINFIVLANSGKLTAAFVAFGINSGAYVAEIVRAGILAVDKGQMEAGRSLGLSYGMTMQKIIYPQAVKNILPALGNEFIVLLKETAVAGYIAVQDLTKAADIIRSRTFDAYMPLLSAALIYLIIVMMMTAALRRLERRLRRSER